MADPGRTHAPLFIGAALLAMGVAYLMLLAQPGLVQVVSRLWSSIPAASGAPSWALPAVAAGVAIGGAAVGVAVLSAFVRGVQAHPFAWLAPVLVGFSTLVMSGMSIELPWPALSLRTFSLLAGLTLLGGGAVMQMRGTASKVAGWLLLTLPSLTLLAGYAAMPAGLPVMLSRLGAGGQLFVFVLALTSLGVGFMAIVTKRVTDEAALFAHHMRDQQLYTAEAIERMRHTEMRLVEAERRAQLAEHQLHAQQASPWAAGAPISDAEAAEFAALARPGMSRSLVIAGAGLALAAAVAGMYFGLYRPMAKRTAAQQAFVADGAKAHAAEIDGLRKQWKAEQASLQALIAAEQTKASEAQAAGEQARGEALACKQTAAAPAAPGARADAPKAAEAKPAKSPSRARRAPSRRVQAKPEPVAAAPSAASSEPQLDRKTQRALRETIDDDPIGGLDGT